ncbi:MAG: hypothetical protein UV92_C0008G0032 [Parcubacteria group bacterium GW2011_GWA1_43_27]|nr:MAG: hypothetical protein UV92_C0008G0032 [Parcubacteria group bacterium GW2011_GWA1_43_27]
MLTFFDYEIPVLKALVKLGGSVKTMDVYSVVEEIMLPKLKNHPEEYGHYKIQTDIIWKNKTQWAREYLKRKGQLDGSVRGVWTITDAGRERLRLFKKTGRDPDEGRATIEGIDSAVAETEESPEKVFKRLDSFHETGAILNVRGIVYEPINEQGVVLLFAAIASESGFLIEGIRSKFPDAQLRRKTNHGTYVQCMAEFEFKSSNYQLHKHPLKGCNLIICWQHDWKDCPIEVLELKKFVEKLR